MIRLYGEPMQDLPPFSRLVNTALQSYALFPHMAVAQSIGLCLELQGKPKAEVATITVERMRALVKLPSGAVAAPSCRRRLHGRLLVLQQGRHRRPDEARPAG